MTSSDKEPSPPAMDRPPMVPIISRQPEFLFATDVEVAQFAANHALVGQVSDSLRCWLSHIAEIEMCRDAMLQRYDRQELLSVVVVYEEMLRYERDTAFFVHFNRDELKACLRLLRRVKEPQVIADVALLDAKVELLARLHGEALNALDYVGHVHSMLASPSSLQLSNVTEGGVWHMNDCSDALPPLFSGLRATWVCCSLFGCRNPARFTALLKWLVRRVECSIHAACFNAIDNLMDAPRNANKIKEVLVAGQDAAVSVQERFHDLRQSLSENGALLNGGVDRGGNGDGAAPLHTIFFDLDDDMLFSTVEWQFHRITDILAAIDALTADPEKLGSALTDPISHIDLLDPDVMDQTHFRKNLLRLQNEGAPSANAIVERMRVKTSTAKALAAKIPFNELTTSLIINVEFNPPAVTVIGGPLSEGAKEAALASLPATCSNTNVLSLRKELLPPRWRELSPKAHRLEIATQFCERDVAQTHFLVTLMDIVETEDAWRMTDTHAYCDAGREVHVLHFRKHRSSCNDSKPRGSKQAGDPRHSVSP